MYSDDILREVNDFVRFVFFPVGHGSCTLVSFPPEEPGGDRIYGVIDCHNATARPISAYLSDPWFSSEIRPKGLAFNLRFVALTHYHEDHMLGIDTLLGNDSLFKHSHFLNPFPPVGEVARRKKDSPNVKKMLYNIEKLATKKWLMHIFRDCSWVYQPKDDHLKNVAFRAMAIAPSNRAINEMKEWHQKGLTPFNYLSAAFRFQWGDCSVIIGGDVGGSDEKDEEIKWNEWEEIFSDLESTHQLKLLSANAALCPHHGGTGNSDILWQRISRCSSYHKSAREIEGRISRTITIVSCSSSRKGSPSVDSLRTFFNANSLVHCTSPTRTCLNLHTSEQPSCISDDYTGMTEKPIELPPGIKLAPNSMPDLPHFVRRSRNDHDFKKGSICVDIFPKRAPKIYFHNGREIVEMTERCSCAIKLEEA